MTAGASLLKRFAWHKRLLMVLLPAYQGSPVQLLPFHFALSNASHSVTFTTCLPSLGQFARRLLGHPPSSCSCHHPPYPLPNIVILSPCYVSEPPESCLSQLPTQSPRFQYLPYNSVPHPVQPRLSCAFFSSSLSLKCALRESGCRIGCEPTTMSRDHFWRLTSRDTSVEVSASSPLIC